MHVNYATAKVERSCTVDREMTKTFDAVMCKSLKLRLGELRAASTTEDLLLGTGRWEQLVGNRAGHWSARLTKNWRLLVRENTTSDVTVTEIIDYH